MVMWKWADFMMGGILCDALGLVKGLRVLFFLFSGVEFYKFFPIDTSVGAKILEEFVCE